MSNLWWTFYSSISNVQVNIYINDMYDINSFYVRIKSNSNHLKYDKNLGNIINCLTLYFDIWLLTVLLCPFLSHIWTNWLKKKKKAQIFPPLTQVENWSHVWEHSSCSYPQPTIKTPSQSSFLALSNHFWTRPPPCRKPYVCNKTFCALLVFMTP